MLLFKQIDMHEWYREQMYMHDYHSLVKSVTSKVQNHWFLNSSITILLQISLEIFDI